MSKLVYHRTAERPEIRLWLLDDNGQLIDLTGHSFAFKLGERAQAAAFTKTTGITGGAGSGAEPTGTPNVVIAFTAGELATAPATQYLWQLRATSGGLDRVWEGDFVLLDDIT